MSNDDSTLDGLIFATMIYLFYRPFIPICVNVFPDFRKRERSI